MTNWVWLNFPLGAAAIMAVVGIPVWLTFKDPDQRPGRTHGPLPARISLPRPGATTWRRWPATAEEALVEANGRPRMSVN